MFYKFNAFLTQRAHSNLLYPDPTRKRTIYRFVIEVAIITFPHWVALRPQKISPPGYKSRERMDSWPTGLGSSLSYSNFAGSNSTRDMLTRSQSGGNGCSRLTGCFTSNHLTACWVVIYIYIVVTMSNCRHNSESLSSLSSEWKTL